MNEIKCPTCDGSGKVHSHNDTCWTCRGAGSTTPEKAAQAKSAEARLERMPKRTWDYV